MCWCCHRCRGVIWMGVKVTGDLKLDSLTRQARDLDGSGVRTGFWNQGDLEMIAGVHEFGADIPVTPRMRKWFAAQGYPLKASTTVIKIPERSFIRAGYDENEPEFVAFVEKTLHDALETGIPKNRVMDMLALMFKGKIQEFMRDLKEPALSDMTKEMSGRSNPLVDSGQLVGNIRSEPE